MQLKQGFKDTEIGVLPGEWKTAFIRDIAIVKTGPFGSSLHERDYVLDGTPIITVEHLDEFGVTHANLPMISDVDKKRLKGYSLEENDIVFSRVGSIDRNSIIRSTEAGWLFSGRLLRIRPNRKTIYSPYLSYHFHGEPFKQRVKDVAVGQTMPSLNTQIINDIIIALPPFPEQRAIATALSDTDALITSLDQLIAKKRDIKQAAMQQLLTGKQRLPGFKKEWEMRTVGTFAECTTGGTPNTSIVSYWGGSIRWMSSGELNLKVVHEVEGRITEEGLKNSSTKLILKDCILIGLAGQGKTRGTVAINKVELCTNQSIAAIQPSPNYVPEYLYYNLDSRYDELRGLSTGDGGRGGLNLSIIRSLVVPLPEIQEQIAIATVLSDMDAEIAALEQRRDKTRLLKQGMMQELLTGRVRLV